MAVGVWRGIDRPRLAFFFRTAFASALIALVSATATAGPADFDASFGSGGLSRLDTATFLAPAAGAQDAQGRILVIGTVRESGRIAIGRLTPAGQIDTGFGSNGRLVMQELYHGYQNPTHFSVRFDSRGRAVLAASVMAPGSGAESPESRAAVYRFSSAGALDASFGTGGMLVFKGPGTGFVLRDLALDSQDRVLLAGKAYSSAAGAPAGADVFRLDDAGQPDTTFGDQGGVTVSRIGFPAAGSATAIAVDAQGGLVLALSQHHPLRLFADGRMDMAFGNEAARTVPVDGATRNVTSLQVQADGRLVFLTRSSGAPGVPGQLQAARLQAGGTFDTTFGNGGRLVSPGVPVSAAMGSAADASGRLLQVGSTYGRSLFSGDAFVARFTADGQPDPAFGEGGARSVDFLEADSALAVFTDRSGRILVLGGMYEAHQDSPAFVLRLLGDADSAAPDSVPDPFVIRRRDAVPVQSRIAFEAVRVTGINQPASVSVQGGEFCVSTSRACGCDVLGAGARKSTVTAGTYVCPFHQSSATGGTTVTSTLDIGGVSATYASTTAGVAVLPPPEWDIGADTWWDVNRPGWGVVLRQRGSLVLGGLYVYGDDRRPVWYGFYCTFTGRTCAAELVHTSGPPLAQSFDAAQVTRNVVGTLNLRFSSRDSVALDISLAGFGNTLSASRQTLLPFPAIGTDLSDLWWNPSESGWGVNLTHRAQSVFMVWYGYDPFGRPLWLTSLCTWLADQCTGTLEQTSGPPLRQAFDSTQVTRQVAGQATLRPGANGSLRLEFTYNGQTYNKVIQRF